MQPLILFFFIFFFCLKATSLKLYRSYDPHRSRDFMSPVCGIFTIKAQQRCTLPRWRKVHLPSYFLSKKSALYLAISLPKQRIFSVIRKVFIFEVLYFIYFSKKYFRDFLSSITFLTSTCQECTDIFTNLRASNRAYFPS